MEYVCLTNDVDSHSQMIVLKEMELAQSGTRIDLYMFNKYYGFKIICKEIVYIIDICEIFFPFSILSYLIYINKNNEERKFSLQSRCLSLSYEKGTLKIVCKRNGRTVFICYEEEITYILLNSCTFLISHFCKNSEQFSALKNVRELFLELVSCLLRFLTINCNPLSILDKVKVITQEKSLYVKFNKDEKHEKLLYEFCQKLGFILNVESLTFAFHFATFRYVSSKKRADFEEAFAFLQDEFKKNI